MTGHRRLRHRPAHEQSQHRPTMSVSRHGLGCGLTRHQPINRDAGNLGHGSDVPSGNRAPLGNSGMTKPAGAGDAGDHATLGQDLRECRVALHGRDVVRLSDKAQEVSRVRRQTFLIALSGCLTHAGAMTLTHDDIARRLMAARAEIGLDKPKMASALGVGRQAYYGWEAGSEAKKPVFPAEEAMIKLCELLPGLTMDYLYRGKLDTMRTALAIRLMAREMGLNPDAVGFDRQAVAAAVAEAA